MELLLHVPVLSDFNMILVHKGFSPFHLQVKPM